MSECSSYSTDANQPGEKLDLCVSGLMVLLYASGNGGGVVVYSGWQGIVCVFSNARRCKGMHMVMHIYVPGSICGIIYLTQRVMLPYSFEQSVAPVLKALKQQWRQELQGSPERHLMAAAANETRRDTLKPSSDSIVLRGQKFKRLVSFKKSG